jgi:hypothetical protein
MRCAHPGPNKACGASQCNAGPENAFNDPAGAGGGEVLA